MARWTWIVVGAASAALALSAAERQDRDAKVRADKEKVAGDGFWIYDDLELGLARAQESEKPLLVVFRCIPCTACAKLDEQVVERDPAVAALLERFVCVRIPRTNGMDLSLFRFDYDQSWAAFFLNADRTIYGRYGTRSHRTESRNDIGIEGFAKALQGALELHAKYPANKASLAAKRGETSPVETPENLPSLKGKYGAELDYAGQVAKSCIHCHQIGEALRSRWRTANEPIPDSVLFPHPNPKVLGLVLDPLERARVASVAAGSSAEKDGFRAGDEITSFAGQPILSTADLQWVLHNAGESGTIATEIVRDGRTIALETTLAPGWRRRDDIAWRATSWDLRRMVTGGLVLEDASADERRAAGIADDVLALRVTHVGQYDAHAVAKNAGFREGDLVLALDGRTERMTESQWLASLVTRTKPGDAVDVKLRRGSETLELKLPMQ